MLQKSHDMSFRSFLEKREEARIPHDMKKKNTKILRWLCDRVQKILNMKPGDAWVELQLLRYKDKGEFGEHGDGVCDFSNNVFRNFPVTYENDKTYEQNNNDLRKDRFSKHVTERLISMDKTSFRTGRRLATFHATEKA